MKVTVRAALVLLGSIACAGAAQAAQTASAGGLSLTWFAGTASTSAVTAAVSGVDWNCAADGCSLAAAPRIDFVFGAGPSGTRLLTEEKAIFEFSVARSSDFQVIDPRGQAHSLVPLLGQWSFGVDVLANQAPANAQINTAQGRFDLEVGDSGEFEAWGSLIAQFPVGPSSILSDVAAVKQGAYIPAGLTGPLTLGPAANGFDTVVPVGNAWNWQLGTQIYSPHHALPSTSNPRCASLSCMDLAPAVLTTGGYRFSVTTQLAPAVPEPSVSALAVLGLALGGIWLRRHRRAA